MNVTDLGERRRRQEKLAALSPEQRAAVCATAAQWRMVHAGSILGLAHERMAEILAWTIAGVLELGEETHPFVTLCRAFGDKFSRDNLQARAEELRKLIPREAETLERLLGVPVAQFPAFKRAQDAEQYRADLALTHIALRAANAGVITDGFADYLQRNVESGLLTNPADIFDLILGNVIARHRIGNGSF